MVFPDQMTLKVLESGAFSTIDTILDASSCSSFPRFETSLMPCAAPINAPTIAPFFLVSPPL